MRPPQGFEWLLIVFIVLLLFGSKRLPDMARGIGRSLRILKAETRGLADDGAADAKPAAAITDSAPAPQTTTTAVPVEADGPPVGQAQQSQAEKPTS